MKKIILLFIVVLSHQFRAQTNVTLQSESFETDGEGVRYTSNNCNTSATRYFMRYTGLPTTPTGFGSVPAWTGANSDGVACWISEDPANNLCPAVGARTLSLNSVNISGYTNLKIKFLIADGRANHTANPNQWESSDEILIEYSLDAGPWTKIGAFYGDQITAGRLRQDLNLNGSAMDGDGGTQVPANFTEYTLNLASTGSTLQVRLYLPHVGATEELAFDYIRVIGDFSGIPPSINTHPSNQTICANSNTSFGIVATNATSYQWQVNTGSGFSNITNGGVYSGATTATLNLTSVPAGMNGYLYQCIAIGSATPNVTSNNATLSVNSAPSAPIQIFGGPTICLGTNNNYNINPVPGATSYSWTVPSGFNLISGQTTTLVTINPGTMIGGNLSVYAINSCGNSTTTSFFVSVNSAPGTPGLISGNSPVCSNSTGQNYTIMPVLGAVSYSWSVPSGASITSGQGTNGITVNFGSASGNITVYASNICGSSAISSKSITVNTSPGTPGVIVGTSPVCSGTTNTYSIASVSGATSYSWTLPSGWGGTSTSNSITAVTGTTSGNITVIALNSCGASSISSKSIIANALPTINIAGSTIICSGNTSTLSASGASSYVWNTLATTSSIIVSPTTTTTFSVTGTDINGCVSSKSVSLGVNPSPTVTATFTSNPVCAGDPIGWDGNSNGTNFNWVGPGGFTSTLLDPPSVPATLLYAGTYTLTATNSFGCFNSATTTLVVNPFPVITVNSGSICSGQSFTITPSGANTYTIQGGNAVVSPTANASYSVVGTSMAGCISSTPSISNVTVNQNPTVTVNSGIICSGSSYTLTPNGANTYSIQGGSAVVSPTATTNYTVVGTSTAGCLSANTATSNVSVNQTPTITVNSGSICSGNSFTIIPNGANTYTIQGGNAVVNPTSNNTYSVVGSSTAGCVSTVVQSSITVNALPVLTVTSSSSLICVGQTASLTVNGANTYTWNPGGPGISIAVSPTVTSTYTITGTDANGCNNTSIITQSVSGCVGIDKLGIDNTELKVFPNPTNGLLYIVGIKDTKVDIYNAIGELVYSLVLSKDNNEIDLINVNSGIYFIRIGNTVKKILKE